MLTYINKILGKILNTVFSIPGLNMLGRALRVLVEKEMSSTQGIVNLTFGVIVAIITLLVLSLDLFSKVVSKLFNISEIPSYYFIITFIGMIIYFKLCISELND